MSFLPFSVRSSCRGRRLTWVQKTDVTVGESLWPGWPLLRLSLQYQRQLKTAFGESTPEDHRTKISQCSCHKAAWKIDCVTQIPLSAQKKPLTVSPALKHSRVVNSLSCSLPVLIVCASADDYILSRSVNAVFKCFLFTLQYCLCGRGEAALTFFFFLFFLRIKGSMCSLCAHITHFTQFGESIYLEFLCKTLTMSAQLHCG